MVKLSAACLIQCAGFPKGYRQGAVGISPRHALIIINYGEATAAEITDFAGLVQERVLDRFGVFLIPEVRLIGFGACRLRERP
jgi:UDP-N-acetylmuramate dehydrogenase